MRKKKIMFILFGLALFLCVTSFSVASEWELLNGELNTSRHGLTGEAINGYIYAICGGNASNNWGTNIVEKYDPLNDSWQYDCSTGVIASRHSLSSDVIDGCIYAIGGHYSNSRSENDIFCGTCPPSWQSGAAVYARSGPGVAAYNGKIYVFGGNHYSTILSRVDVYDPNTDSWSSGCDMPVATEPWRATTLGDKIYVNYAGDNKQIWCYDPNSCTWDTNVPAMNVSRGSYELQATCGRIYAIGGNSGSGAISSVESWAPGEASWRMEPTLNAARAYFASAVIGNNIYVFGGTNGGDLGSTEVLHVGPVVLSPNGGEELVSGNEYSIQWDGCAVTDPNVLIEYSTNNGQNWTSIGLVENTGTYEWTVPTATSNQCLIRISDSFDPDRNDVSDDIFTIFECQIQFLADLYHDCRVDFRDFAILANEWMLDGNPFGSGCKLWSTDGNTVALWHLNGNGDDDSGNSNHLQVHPTNPNAVNWDYGKYCFGAVMGVDDWSGSCFNSTGAALTAPGSGCTYPGSGDWTIEAWVLFPSNSGSYSAVSHYSKHWAGHDPYHIGVSNGQAFFHLEDSSNNSIYISADASAYIGQWVHIAGVYRYQQDVAIYVNSVRVAYETTTLIPEYLPSYDVFVGGSYCGTSTDLKVDEVRISNTARYAD